jgi:hypothetical protein
MLSSMAAPEYSALFGSKTISDLTIVLQEEPCPADQLAAAAHASEPASAAEGTPASRKRRRVATAGAADDTESEADQAVRGASADGVTQAIAASQVTDAAVAAAAAAEEGLAHAEVAVAGTGAQKELPGHSVVLYGYSSFCKVKLENWSDVSTAGSSSSANSGKVLCIIVPPGEPEQANADGHKTLHCHPLLRL